MPDGTFEERKTWLVWRPGCPDPSRPSAALHHDDPAKDRARDVWLCPPILIAVEHRGMSIRELLTIDRYNLPAPAGPTIDAVKVNLVEPPADLLPVPAPALEPL